tara:strand:+ start:1609 stop:1896 length:288 start_codon:yes stop_codon:yes gene_type:complete
MFKIEMTNDFSVGVQTTSYRGHTPEELADMCAEKIVSVSQTAHPTIRQQAEAFKEQLRHTVLHYLKQAAASDRTTVYNAIQEAGQPKLAELIRRL